MFFFIFFLIDRIRPVCLPFEGSIRTESFIGKNPFTAGWGATSEVSYSSLSIQYKLQIKHIARFLIQGGKASTVLQQIQVPVLDNSVCKKEYTKVKKLATPNQFDAAVICAGHLAGGIDACKGDSGGPLMLPIRSEKTFAFYQIGIVSYGIGCARKNIPTAYTNVPHFIDWIQYMLKKTP